MRFAMSPQIGVRLQRRFARHLDRASFSIPAKTDSQAVEWEQGAYEYSNELRSVGVMARPHEDRERHTSVDHRPGGLPVAFARGAWCAIDIVHVTAERAGAAISTYETLIEQAQTSAAKARAAVVLRSANHRRVIAIVGLEGHGGFAHLASAWDAHHLYAEHHAVAESVALALYQVKEVAGDVLLDAASHEAYAFERTAADAVQVATLIEPLKSAAGFRGALVFGGDTTGTAIVYWFEHAAQIDAFRAGATAQKVLGSAGDAEFAVYPVKTFDGD
jgi:hypothetical protein